MRCAVIAAVLLLVYIQDAAAGPQGPIVSMCKNKYPPKHCGGRWYRIDPRRCAKYFKENKKFDDAEGGCQSFGSHLVSIHNADEHNNVMCLSLRTTNNGNCFWIGGKLEGYMRLHNKWIDGTDSSFDRWYVLQPDNHWEKCVEMNFGDWGYWNNERCKQTQHFVCARDM